MERQPLFKVIDHEHEYIVYPNGEIEGFGEGALVFNYFPQLVRDHAEVLRKQA